MRGHGRFRRYHGTLGVAGNPLLDHMMMWPHARWVTQVLRRAATGAPADGRHYPGADPCEHGGLGPQGAAGSHLHCSTTVFTMSGF